MWRNSLRHNFQVDANASRALEVHGVVRFPKSLGSGSFPTSGVIFDRAGNLYGAAGGGIGSCSGGCGVVYQLTPQRRRQNGNIQFCISSRARTASTPGGGGVVLDGNGNLYGTAYDVVFEITP